MNRRTVKLMSAVAALSIVASGAVMTQVARAAAPAVWQAQEDRGLIVLRVVSDGPAAQAGLKRADIITKLNDTEINDITGLQAALKALKAGDEVTLTFMRGDKEQTAKVKLGDVDGRAYLGIVTEGVAEEVPSTPATPAQPQQPAQPNQPNQPAQPGRRMIPFNMQPQFKVTEVVTNSPAAKAGVLKDDVIISVDGKVFDMQTSLADVVKSHKPGDEVTLNIKRGDKTQDIKVTLGENSENKGVAYLGIRYGLDTSAFGNMMPGQPNNRTPRGNGQPNDQMPFPMPRGNGQGQQGTPFEMPQGMMQVNIAEVTKDSPADKAGLKAGDVISAANGTAINTPDELVKLVQAAKPGDKLTLSIVRDGKAQDIAVTLGENPDKKGAGYLGIALGATMKFDNMMPGQQGGMQMMPGFGGFPFQAPDQTPQQNDTQS